VLQILGSDLFGNVVSIKAGGVAFMDFGIPLPNAIFQIFQILVNQLVRPQFAADLLL
jgi:hypothetical protein